MKAHSTPCPNAAAHTPHPTRYLGHGAWAEQMLLTHDQHQCPACDLYAIWEPKPKTAQAAPAIADNNCTRCGTYYPEGTPIRADVNGGWIASTCCPPLRCLTVRPPWSFAIAALGKQIENRTWRTDHRGLLAIHAGAHWDNRGALRVAELSRAVVVKTEMSAIVAVAELVDIHRSFTCIRPPRERHFHADGPFTCSKWAMGLDEPDGMWHWELANVRRLAEPVECKGQLRLWDAPGEVEAAVLAQIGATA